MGLPSSLVSHVVHSIAIGSPFRNDAIFHEGVGTGKLTLNEIVSLLEIETEDAKETLQILEQINFIGRLSNIKIKAFNSFEEMYYIEQKGIDFLKKKSLLSDMIESKFYYTYILFNQSLNVLGYAISEEGMQYALSEFHNFTNISHLACIVAIQGLQKEYENALKNNDLIKYRASITKTFRIHRSIERWLKNELVDLEFKFFLDEALKHLILAENFQKSMPEILSGLGVGSSPALATSIELY